MRVAFVLPGLHSVVRGAEVAFESIAQELAQRNDCTVTLFGSGPQRPATPYHFINVSRVAREKFEKWPQIPLFRNEYVYEEFSFAMNLWGCYRPEDFDVTVTCSYPFVNWILMSKGGKDKPQHVFVTQNGDYPAICNDKEYRFFACDGLVCTNPEYFERNKSRWFSQLITNGVAPTKFFPGPSARENFELPENVPLVLMVSALIPSKRTIEGVNAIAQMSDVHLVICGDGPEREHIRKVAQDLAPDRVHFRAIPFLQMPMMYRSVDVFLHLSLDEPFGNVYLEALASGLPIVSHSRGVTQWILEDTATLVDTCDRSQIIAGIRTALASASSETVQKGCDLVNRRFSWSKIGDDYYHFFENVIRQKYED